MKTYNMQNTPKQWIDIEGYSKYETNGERVRNKTTCRIIKPVNGRYLLYDDDTKKTTCYLCQPADVCCIPPYQSQQVGQSMGCITQWQDRIENKI